MYTPERWKRIKEALLEGLTPGSTRHKVLDVCLDNTIKHLKGVPLMEQAPGSTAAGNIATLNKVILPVIRRVMPGVIAHEIIGVQPMTGPVAQVHTLRVTYANTVPAAGGGVTAGTEALGPFAIARYYSGNEDPANPRAAATAALEGRPGNQISVQILREVVEAKTRKLSATWTFEAAQDAQAQQGIDLEAEILAALAQEITVEIDQEILNNLRNLATPGPTYDQNAISTGGTGTNYPVFVGDQHAALMVLVNRVANLIGARTRRGNANWMVVSHTALSILQSATTSAFARTTEGTFEGPTNTKFVGVVNGSMRVYVDGYAGDSVPILVGFKGEGEVDAAAYYCPYVPLTTPGVVIDPQFMQPVVSFMTRYGYLELRNRATSLGNASDYLSTIPLQNISFI